MTPYELWLAAHDIELAAHRTTLTFDDFCRLHDGEPLTHLTGRDVRRSWTTLERCELTVPDGFTEVDAWADAGRAVWVSSADRAFITYCEGDVDIERCADDATFAQAWTAADRFYR